MLKDLFLIPDIDKGQVKIQFTCPHEFHNCSIVISNNNNPISLSDQILISGKENLIIIDIPDFILWEPENHHLYHKIHNQLESNLK